MSIKRKNKDLQIISLNNWNRLLSIQDKVIGLDFGNSMGVTAAIYKDGKWIILPEHIFAISLVQDDKYETYSQRFLRLYKYLDLLSPQAIGFERVAFTPSRHDKFAGNPYLTLARTVSASEYLASLRAVVLLWAEENKVPVKGYSVRAVKLASGNGRASKSDIVASCNHKYNTNLNAKIKSHCDAADSAFVCQLLLSDIISAKSIWNLRETIKNISDIFDKE